MIKYWLLVVAASCVTVAVAYLPPPKPTAPKPQTRIVRSDSSYLVRQDDAAVWYAYREYAAAAERLRFGRMYARILERGDSILKERGGELTSDADVLLTFGPKVPAELRQVVRARLNYASGDLVRPVSWPQAAVVAVVLDTAGDDVNDRSIRFYMPRDVYVLPREPGQPCLSLVTIGRGAKSELASGRVRPRSILGSSPLDLLGPCAFYSQFGVPGSSIGDWVQRGQYMTTLRPGWLAPRRWRDPVSRRWSWNGHVQYPVLTACASGDPTACLAAPTMRPYRPEAVLDAGRPQHLAVGWQTYWYWSMPLGPSSASFLSDMVVALGEDRFARFWNSEQPVNNAFLAAAGTSLEDWTMAWARSQIGTPRRGPSVPAGSTMLSLLLCAVFVGGGVLFARRREVG